MLVAAMLLLYLSGTALPPVPAVICMVLALVLTTVCLVQMIRSVKK